MAEDEDKILKASPLTLTRVLKTPIEGEEVARIKKIRRIEEQPREIVPTVEAKVECGNEEIGVFEDYTKQPMLLPTIAEETIAPPIRT